MSNSRHRGAQPGNQNSAKPDTFRGRARAWANDPNNWPLFEEWARADPSFAIKLIEQGIGRAPQAISIEQAGQGDMVYRVRRPDDARVIDADVVAGPDTAEAVPKGDAMVKRAC